MATTQENDDFARSVLANHPLDEAVEWIRCNLTPGDVFDDDELFEYTCQNATPEEVFSDRELMSWAEQNGYEST